MTFTPDPDLHLHPQGDFYGSMRLPEFQASIEYDGSEHPLHYVGRYCVCEIHSSALTQGMFLGDTEKEYCAQAAKNWNDKFRLDKKGDWLSDIGDWITIKGDQIDNNAGIIKAAILKEIRHHTQASYKTIVDLVTTYPELYQDPAWLKEHQALDITAPLLALVKHFQIPEIIPLAKAYPIAPDLFLWQNFSDCQAAGINPASKIDELINSTTPPLWWWPALRNTPLQHLETHRINRGVSPSSPDSASLSGRMAHDNPSLGNFYIDFLLHPWSSSQISQLSQGLENHPERNTSTVVAWQQAGWTPDRILEAIDVILEETDAEWLAPDPLPAEPWQDDLYRERTENTSIGIEFQGNFFTKVEQLAAAPNWWQDIPPEVPLLDQIAPTDESTLTASV